jgi:hypothetical protein
LGVSFSPRRVATTSVMPAPSATASRKVGSRTSWGTMPLPEKARTRPEASSTESAEPTAVDTVASASARR